MSREGPPTFHASRQANPTRPNSPRDARACFNFRIAFIAVAELFACCISRRSSFSTGSLSLIAHLHMKMAASFRVIIRIALPRPGSLASNCCSRERDIGSATSLSGSLRCQVACSAANRNPNRKIAAIVQSLGRLLCGLLRSGMVIGSSGSTSRRAIRAPARGRSRIHLSVVALSAIA